MKDTIGCILGNVGSNVFGSILETKCQDISASAASVSTITDIKSELKSCFKKIRLEQKAF